MTVGDHPWSVPRTWRRAFVLVCAVAVAGSFCSALYLACSCGRLGSFRVRLFTLNAATRQATAHQTPQVVRQIAQDIIRQSNCGQSPHGKRYRSLICTIVRNDLHLREFIVRHLLLGFCHIVIYDNNQVLQGRDRNILPVVEPFVQLGVVTHVPYMQNVTGGLLAEKDKDAHLADCLKQVGNQADWVAALDSDEYINIAAVWPSSTAAKAVSATTLPEVQQHSGSQQTLHQLGSVPSSIGILNTFLTSLEHNSGLNDTCALVWPWQMMYGEHRVLKSSSLLMDAYPRVCFTHGLPKLMFRPDYFRVNPPHGGDCAPGSSAVAGGSPRDRYSRKISVSDPFFKKHLPQYTANLVHYYSRSVEEYVLKSEQSIPPFFRQVPHMYDAAKHCDMWEMPYDEQYKEVVKSSINSLRAAQSVTKSSNSLPQSEAAQSTPEYDQQPEYFTDAGELLHAPPEAKPLSRPDYALYMFMKLRVAQQHEWDEAAYLVKNPEALAAVQKGEFADGLSHFLNVGFDKGISCWTDAWGEASCIG